MNKKMYIVPVTEQIITSYQESLLIGATPTGNADDPYDNDNRGGTQLEAKRHNIWDEGGVENFTSIWK